MKEIIVIGGGASGLMAAYAAAVNGAKVTLIEKNEKLGKKIYITGKGRCNLTNDVEPMEFLQNVVRGSKFLMSSIHTLSPQKLMQLFSDNSLEMKTERGNRVFPVSDHASDVTATMQKMCKNNGVDIFLNTQVLSVEKDGETFIIKCNDKIRSCDCVIVATGGLSYPSTGSTGDGYKFAKNFSHTITPLIPSLVGFNVGGREKELTTLSGLSLKNVGLTALLGEKVICSDFGEMLFTHFGISGPIVLSTSAQVNRSDLKNVRLVLDLKPALDEETLDKRLVREFEANKNKSLSNVMKELLPLKMIPVFLRLSSIDGEKKSNAITREERAKLVQALKNFEIHPVSLRGFEEAIVTSGGINLNEINPKTMESKKCEGLYFCGEVLDVDAFTGGFNLQIAFATGYVAGCACAKEDL